MAKLIVNPTSSSRREISLPRTLLSIGRDPGNDLVLPDAMVSRRHAVIECRGSQYFLRDCNSSNGSLVNGDRVSERSLRDGDLVAIGTARLLFRDELAMAPGAKVVPHPSSPRLHCTACGADYRKGDQFCRQCGGTLAPSLPPKAVCTSCGTAVPLPAKFCTACGRGLASAPDDAVATNSDDAAAASPAAGADSPAAPSVAAPEPSPLQTVSPSDAPAVEAKEPSDAVRRPVPAPVAREVAAPAPAAPPKAAKRFPDTFRDRVPAARSEPAGAMARLAAALVDHGLVALLQALVLAPVVWYWWAQAAQAPRTLTILPIAASALAVALAIGLGCAYFVYGWGVRGATPGKALLGIAVESTDGAFPIGVSTAVVRLLGYILSSALLGIGHLVIAFGLNGLQDRLAGTRVVHRGKP